MSKCQKDVKLSKRCQVDKCQKVKSLDYEGGSQKLINWHNKVYRYWCQVWCQIWRSPKLSKNTFCANFEGFWLPSYVISKLMSICVNFIMSIYFLWISIVQVFEFLTIDIFLTTWHHLTFCCPITYVPHYSWEQGWWAIGNVACPPSRSTWG